MVLKKLLKDDDIPSVFVIRCICHSWHFVLVELSMSCPLTSRYFLKNVPSYISKSSIHRRDCSAIHQVFRVVPHKIMKMSQTRWISQEKVMRTVIEPYDAFRKIFDTSTNFETKHMLLFLQYLLKM